MRSAATRPGCPRRRARRRPSPRLRWPRSTGCGKPVCAFPACWLTPVSAAAPTSAMGSMNANWLGRSVSPALSLSIRPPSNCVRHIRRAGGLPSTRCPTGRRSQRPRCWTGDVGVASPGATAPRGPLNARFAAVRVRVADGPLNAEGTRLPGEELWLISEWRDSGEKKYYLSNLPKRTTLRRVVASVKARWSCEQVHQQLKQELGLGDFEGRSWTGLHRPALMTCIAFAYLQHRRLKAAGRGKKGGAQRTAAAAIAA